MAFEFQTWRCSHAYPGEACVLFSTKGLMGQTPMTLPAGWSEASSPSRYNNVPSWSQNWLRAVKVPDGCPPGTYPVAWKDWGGNEYAAAVRVVPRPAWRYYPGRVPLDWPAGKGGVVGWLTDQTAKGYNVFRFVPGPYDWLTRLSIPAKYGPVILDGQGCCRLTRRPEGKYRYDAFVDTGKDSADVSLCGFAVEGLGHANAVYGGDTYRVRRFDVRDCVLHNCTLGFWPGADIDGQLNSCLIRRVVFNDRSGTGALPAGAWVDWCRFRGPSSVAEHAYFNQGQPRNLTTNSQWWGTSRGWVNSGPVEGCLLLGGQAYGIGRGEDSGSELLMLENYDAGRFAQGNAVVCYQAEACTGPGLSLFGGNVRDNYFADLQIGASGLGVLFAKAASQLGQPAPGPVTGNRVENCQFDGPVYCSDGVTGNSFVGVTVRRLPRSCGNATPLNGPWSPEFPNPDTYGLYYGAGGLPFRDSPEANSWSRLALEGADGRRTYYAKSAAGFSPQTPLE